MLIEYSFIVYNTPNSKMELLIAALIILALYIPCDLYIDQWLWTLNTTFTTYIQNHAIKIESIFFAVITQLIYLPPVLGVWLYIRNIHKIRSLLYLFNVILAFVLNGALKNIYHQTRPYMVEPEIKGLSCSSEYGKPSGHAHASIVFYFGAILSYAQTFKAVSGSQNLLSVQSSKAVQYSNYGKGRRFRLQAALTTATLMVILIGLSRIYLGVHSIGQVLLGWVYGLMQLGLFKLAQKPLSRYFDEQFEAKKCEKRFQKAAQISLIICVGLSVLNVTLLELNKKVFYESSGAEGWLESVDKCKNVPIGTNSRNSVLVLYNLCFLQTTLFSFIAAFLQGCHYSQSTFDQGQLLRSQCQLGLRQEFRRLLCYLPMLLPLPLVLLIPFDQVYLMAYFGFTPFSIFCGFYLTNFYQIILKKLGLQLDGEFLAVEDQQPYQSLIE